MRNLIPLALLLATTLAGADTTITYQGQLQDGAGPHSGSVNMVFELFDAETGGSSVGSAVSAGNVAVNDGLFQVELDFGNQAYENGLYLEIEVDGETLSPRQPITAAPLAVRTLSGSGSSSSWSVSGDDIFFDGGNVAIGTNDAGGHNLWVSGTFASGNPNNDASGNLSAVVGGGLNRTIGIHSFVGGGTVNEVFTHRSAITGGTDNSIGSGSPYSAIAGGSDNRVSEENSFIGGGENNETSGARSAIVGGFNNEASGNQSAIAGGGGNEASGNLSAIAGGNSNTASGINSFIGGGIGNTASGFSSFAAGSLAKAEHNGTFVWGDNTSADFASTGEDQFLIRAGGGVGIGTNAPERDLHIKADTSSAALILENASDVNGWGIGTGIASGNFNFYYESDVTGFSTSGTRLGGISNTTGEYSSNSDRRLKQDIEVLNGVLADVLKLEPASYRFRRSGDDGPRTIGFLAQDVQEVFPELVTHEDGDDYLGLSYANFSVLAIRAVQEQQDIIENQQARIAELEQRQDNEVAALQERLAALESLLLESHQVAEHSQ